MGVKYYITNGDKYIANIVMMDDSNRPKDNYSAVIKDIDRARRFKLQEAKDFINTMLGGSPEWACRKVSNKSSKKNYVITTGVNYVGSGGKVTLDFSQAKPFNSPADAQAYINNHRELNTYFRDYLIIDGESNPYDKSVGKQFTPQQLEVLGIAPKYSNRVMIPKSVREEIYARDHGICGICGQPVLKTDYTVDHIVPLSQCGSNDITNLRVAHRHCNELKGSFMDDEMNTVVFNIATNQISKKPFDDDAAKLIRAMVRGELAHYGY